MRQIYLIVVILIYTCNLFAQVNLDSLLVAYYPFNGNANDESGNGHHGTIFGATPTFDRFGNPNQAFLFDGDDWIDVPDDSGLTLGSDPFTMLAWMQFSAFSVDGGYYLMGHSTGGGNTNKWIFWTGNTSISFIVGPSLGWIYIGPVGFEIGLWYFVAIRRSGNELTAFVDGSSIGTVALTIGIPDPSAPFQIGSAEYAVNHPNRRFRGSIDDIRIYNRDLSQAEIDSLYNEIPTSIEILNSNYPKRFELKQNYPNPFNPFTTIEYNLPERAKVKLTVYDVLGNEISHLVNEEQKQGNYKIEFNGNELSSGVYFYRLQVYAPGRAGSFVETKKMVLMK